MAGFDFIDVSMRGYKTVWENREGIMRVVALPIFIKMGCFAAVIFLGIETNFLRQGLVLLPSYFAEGFIAVYVLRMILGGHKIDGNIKTAEPYARDLTAATIVYVLIKLALSFVAGMTLNNALIDAATGEQAATEEPSAAMFFLMLATLAFVIWSFRLLWIYVPTALGIPMLRFLRRIPGYGISFQMMGVWLICFVPFGVLMMVIYQIVAGALGHSAEAPSALFPLLLIPVQSVIEVAIALVSSVAMAYGIQQIFKGDKKP